MNKFKIKILLIFVFLTLTTGCQVKTDITINKDLTVLEELNMTGTSDFFGSHYKNMPLTVVKRFLSIDEHEKTLNENGYFYEIKKDGKYPYLYVSKNYHNLQDFASKTIFKKQYFEDLIVNVNNNLITLKSFNFIKYEEGDQELNRYDIKKFSLNIKVPFVVTNHNADSYDKKTNTYTWYIDTETSEKEINLTFDKNKIYVYNLVMYISIFIIILLLIILIFIFRNVVKKGKMNNKISE